MVALLIVSQADVVRSHYPVPILNVEIHMKVGDKVTRYGNEYTGWVGQIIRIEDTGALVKWDPTYPGPGVWVYLDSLNVVDDSLVVGKQ